MYTLFAAASIAAALAGPDHHHLHGNRCLPGFAPQAPTIGHLATLPPEDVTRVHSARNPGLSGRLWVGRSVSSELPSDRSVQLNPGNLAYGAIDQGERVHARVNHVVVTISPWERIDAEGLQHLERARLQWLRERGYTDSVRTFVHPRRTRDVVTQMQSGGSSVMHRDERPEPAATIRLRTPARESGVIRGVDSGVRGGSRVIAVTDSVRVSLPPMAGRELAERCEARGWTDAEGEQKTASAGD